PPGLFLPAPLKVVVDPPAHFNDDLVELAQCHFLRLFEVAERVVGLVDDHTFPAILTGCEDFEAEPVASRKRLQRERANSQGACIFIVWYLPCHIRRSPST